MFRTTLTLRRIAAVVVVGALGTFAAPTAFAASGVDGRSPDTVDAARAAHEAAPQPHVTKPEAGRLYTTAMLTALSAYSSGLAWSGVLPHSRTPDPRGPAAAQGSAKRALQESSVADGRSPDTRDFSALAHSPVVTVVQSPGFEWGDFGIGVAAALAVVLIVLGSFKLVSGRKGRRQAGPVATA